MTRHGPHLYKAATEPPRGPKAKGDRSCKRVSTIAAPSELNLLNRPSRQPRKGAPNPAYEFRRYSTSAGNSPQLDHLRSKNAASPLVSGRRPFAFIFPPKSAHF